MALEQALTAAEATVGTDHPLTANIHSQLARAYEASDFERAKQHLVAYVRFRETVEVARAHALTVYELAELHAWNGRPGALPYNERAISLLEGDRNALLDLLERGVHDLKDSSHRENLDIADQLSERLIRTIERTTTPSPQDRERLQQAVQRLAAIKRERALICLRRQAAEVQDQSGSKSLHPIRIEAASGLFPTGGTLT